MSRRFRFASHTLLVDSGELTLKAVENIAPFVERPWGHNREARDAYQKTATPASLRQPKFASKIEIVEGDWMTEEAQRNGVDRASGDVSDYLLVRAADEFTSRRESRRISQKSAAIWEVIAAAKTWKARDWKAYAVQRARRRDQHRDARVRGQSRPGSSG